MLRLLYIAEEFYFTQYNLLSFTDTSIAICKIYVVGDDAYIVPWADVGIRPYKTHQHL